MDFEAEYSDFFENLGPEATCAYKFFDLFKVNLVEGNEDKSQPQEKGLHWGKSFHDDELTDDQLKALRTYVKNAKSWIRKQQKEIKPDECRQRMWFLVQKLIEFGAFCRGDRNQIIQWMASFNYVNGYVIEDSSP